jgi:hypothetical protein
VIFFRFLEVNRMGNYRIAVNKVHRNFNREEIWNHHIVQIYGGERLSFCGTKADLMDVEDADTYVSDIKKGKNMNDREEDSFCKRCISSVLADGSDLEKDEKRIGRHHRKQENIIKKKLKFAHIKRLKRQIIERFLSKSPCCKDTQKITQHGYVLRVLCEKCNREWLYSLSCETDGTFKLSIDKNKIGERHQTAIGNILCEKPFIKYF